MGPIPELDVTNPVSQANFLNYLARLGVHTYEEIARHAEADLNALAEVKGEIAALSVWQDARERERNVQQGRNEERQEQRDRGEKRLGRWKLRFETVGALVGVAGGGFGVGAVLAAIVFG